MKTTYYKTTTASEKSKGTYDSYAEEVVSNIFHLTARSQCLERIWVEVLNLQSKWKGLACV